jgi:hypothetical protein
VAAVLRAALKRIAVVVVVLVAGTAAVSVTLGALAHANLAHSIAVGYYVVGAAVLLGSFVVGGRGPLRREWGDEAEVPVVPPTIFSMGRGPLRRRSVRKATPEERREARMSSVGLFALGLVLVLIGIAIDPSKRAF